LNRIKARTTAGMALQDLAQATLDKRITAEQFTELVVKGKLFPELGFLLGTVKVEDGISSDTKAQKKLQTQTHDALKCAFRMVSGDATVLKTPPGQDRSAADKAFAELHYYLLKKVGLEDPDHLTAFYVALASKNLGKATIFSNDVMSRCIIGAEGAPPENHDEIVMHAMVLHETNSELTLPPFLPSFGKLKVTQRLELLEGFKTKFPFGQFGQLECVPGSLLQLSRLAKMRTLNGQPFDGARALYAYLMMHVVAIAGNMGGALPSFVWTHVFKKSVDALQNLTEPGFGPMEAYATFLHETNDQMKISDVMKTTGSVVLRRTTSTDFGSKQPSPRVRQAALRIGKEVMDDAVRAVVRIARMMRLSKPDDAAVLVDAWKSLHQHDAVCLERELIRTGIEDGWALVLMYMPSVLQAVAIDSKSKAWGEEHSRARGTPGVKDMAAQKSAGWAEGFRLMSKVFMRTRQQLEELLQTKDCPAEENGVYTVNCHALVAWASKITGIRKRGFGLEHHHSTFEGLLYMTSTS